MNEHFYDLSKSPSIFKKWNKHIISCVDLLKQFRLNPIGGMVYYNRERQDTIVKGRAASIARLQTWL